jgi:hypothetical protein
VIPIVNRDPGDENPPRLRDVLHTISEALPAPKTEMGGMTRDELWDAVELLSRLMSEAVRRRLALDVFDTLDVARAMTLAMYSTTDRPEHSERVAAAGGGDAA